jgi:isopenicillin-N epimerase
VGSLSAVPLPDARQPPATVPPFLDALQDALWNAERLEVPIVPWPAAPRRLVRLSAHIYNDPSQFDRLAEALIRHLGAV